MSRSKKNYKLKWGCFYHWVSFRSNKQDKRIANRKMRRNNRVLIKIGKEPLNKLKEVCDIWNFNSDGETIYTSYRKQNRYNTDNSIYGTDAWSAEDIRKINQK